MQGLFGCGTMTTDIKYVCIITNQPIQTPNLILTLTLLLNSKHSTKYNPMFYLSG